MYKARDLYLPARPPFEPPENERLYEASYLQSSVPHKATARTMLVNAAGLGLRLVCSRPRDLQCEI